MKVFTKESLVAELQAINMSGWIESCRQPGNDGAVGNTLEGLLGIAENNLPLPNATEWEIKGQRRQTSSLLTLFHMDPSPRAMGLITNLLLPKYGWPLDNHPDEWSFRLTIGTAAFNDRGFRVVVDDIECKVVISFDARSASQRQQDWLQSVSKRVGLGELDPQPYWGFDDLEHKAGTKLKNTFYVVADSRTQDGVEYFRYNGIMMLQTFSFENFLNAIQQGILKIDFDARSGHGRRAHNHGTKFRIPANLFPGLYEKETTILDEPLDPRERLKRIDISSISPTSKKFKKIVSEGPTIYQMKIPEE
jgi:hypothetical protein